MYRNLEEKPQMVPNTQYSFGKRTLELQNWWKDTVHQTSGNLTMSADRIKII